MVRSQPIVDLKNSLKSSFLGSEKIRERRYIITLRRKRIQDAVKVLVDKHNARFSALSGMDLGLDLELLYHLSIGGEFYSLKTIVPKEDLKISSIAKIIPGSNWSEREVRDLFGVEFEGHPDSRSFVLPFEWELKGYMPLKKPMKGLLSSFQKPTVENLLNQGLIFPLSELAKRIRGKLKLDEVPATAAARLEDLKEVQRLIKTFKFDQKVGFDWNKKKMRY